MLTLNLNNDIQNKIMFIANKYQNDYNTMFSDIISYKITQLKKNINSLQLDFYEYENKYSMTTTEFYKLFENGELGDENFDFFKWSGKYEFWLDFNEQLKKLEN